MARTARLKGKWGGVRRPRRETVGGNGDHRDDYDDAASVSGVTARQSRVLLAANVEVRIILAELDAVDASMSSVIFRLARRMAVVAKHDPSALGLLDVSHSAAVSTTATAIGPSRSCHNARALEVQLSRLEEDELRRRLDVQRLKHESLLEQQAMRVHKWERLLETVATLPTEVRRRVPRISRSVQFEADLRLGAHYLPVWRSEMVVEMPTKPMVLMVDVQRGLLRLLEDGAPTLSLPFHAVPSLYPGYRASHLRSAAAEISARPANATTSTVTHGFDTDDHGGGEGGRRGSSALRSKGGSGPPHT